MALMNLLRDIPNKVVQMMMDKGYARVLTEEERMKMAEDVKAFTEEMFGEKAVKEKKAKPQVVHSKPEKVDRAYLETLTVTELKELGKDCAGIKGRKPRPEIIEILLRELGAPSPVVASAAPSPVAPSPVVATVPSPVADENGTTTDEASSDDELRAEVPPPFARASATVSTAEVAKKKKAEKPKVEKPPKEKKEKKEKKTKAPVAVAAAVEDPESEEETLTVKEWFHPNEMSKPKEERTKYYIDPATNYIYDPEDTEEPMGQWDEGTKEIIPVK